MIYNKYNVFAVILLVGSVIIMSSINLWLFVASTLAGLLTAPTLPLIALILSFFAKGRSKWVLMIISIVLFLYIAYITVLVIGFRYFVPFAP